MEYLFFALLIAMFFVLFQLGRIMERGKLANLLNKTNEVKSDVAEIKEFFINEWR